MGARPLFAGQVPGTLKMGECNQELTFRASNYYRLVESIECAAGTHHKAAWQGAELGADFGSRCSS